jgi:hypothetical protein
LGDDDSNIWYGKRRTLTPIAREEIFNQHRREQDGHVTLAMTVKVAARVMINQDSQQK